MQNIDNQSNYWDSVAWSKSFTIPIDIGRFASLVPHHQRILDCGCGYGRICGELWNAGYRSVTGVDSSPEMIARARHEHPEIDFHVLGDSVLPYEDAAFDAVTLFAVLTCIPTNEGQSALLHEISRILTRRAALHS
jgi:SAM-dependent methyltransferase